MAIESDAGLLERAPAQGGGGSSPDACPHCGRSSASGGGRRRMALAVTAVIAAGAGAGVTALFSGGHSHASRHSRSAHPVAAQSALQGFTVTAPQQSEQATAAQRRKTLERELEASIVRDGRKLAGVNYLQGPIIGSTCTLRGSVEATAAGVVAHYTCMAIRRRIPNSFKGAPPTLEGARFFGTINFTANTYTYRGD